ncbi:hypothetical protein [Halioxenophilus aromaticivorans]|uniref:hypothetical protein n=1 Tax=Halioxenophilus aromaticivorans TaxID=1306992 RepID=UPI0031E5EC31
MNLGNHSSHLMAGFVLLITSFSLSIAEPVERRSYELKKSLQSSNINALSKSEIKKLERGISAASNNYQFRVFDRRRSSSDLSISLIENKRLRGALFARDLNTLVSENIGDRKVYDDGSGGFIIPIDISRGGEVRMPAVFGIRGSGDLVEDYFSLDVNNDGSIDLMIGGVNAPDWRWSRDWIISNALGDQALQCFITNENITTERLKTMIAAGPLVDSAACPGGPGGLVDASRRSGGSGSSISFFGALPGKGYLGPPRCNSDDPEGRVMNDGEDEDKPPLPSEQGSGTQDDESDQAPTLSIDELNRSTAQAVREVVEEEESQLRENLRFAAGDGTDPDSTGGGGFGQGLSEAMNSLGRTIGDWRFTVEIKSTAASVLRFLREEGRTLPTASTLINEQARERAQIDSRPNNNEPLPDGGGVAPPSDSRCMGQQRLSAEDKMAQGCSPMEPDDICLARSDPASLATAGQCRTVPGKAGGDMIECRSKPGSDWGCKTDNEGNCMTTCRPNELQSQCTPAPGSGVAGKYDALLPFGSVLAGLCQVDAPGCGAPMLPGQSIDTGVELRNRLPNMGKQIGRDE